MTTLTEGQHAGEFIVSEANKTRSRDPITVAAGQNLKAGAVLGKITASGEYAAYNPAGVDGTETAAGVLYDAVDASAAAAPGVAIVRDAEVNKGELVFADGTAQADIDAAIAELAAVGIIAR